MPYKTITGHVIFHLGYLSWMKAMTCSNKGLLSLEGGDSYVAMIFTSTVRTDNLFPSNFPHLVAKSHKFTVHVNEILKKKKLLMHTFFNPLNTELNPISHLLALFGAHHILHVSRIRVKSNSNLHSTT
jgi:hypothetical protein